MKDNEWMIFTRNATIDKTCWDHVKPIMPVASVDDAVKVAAVLNRANIQPWITFCYASKNGFQTVIANPFT